MLLILLRLAKWAGLPAALPCSGSGLTGLMTPDITLFGVGGCGLRAGGIGLLGSGRGILLISVGRVGRDTGALGND